MKFSTIIFFASCLYLVAALPNIISPPPGLRPATPYLSPWSQRFLTNQDETAAISILGTNFPITNTIVGTNLQMVVSVSTNFFINSNVVVPGPYITAIAFLSTNGTWIISPITNNTVYGPRLQ